MGSLWVALLAGWLACRMHCLRRHGLTALSGAEAAVGLLLFG
jgi:hypothetical protein